MRRVAIALLLALVAGAGGPAAAATNGQISGRVVSDDGGTPVAGICVSANVIGYGFEGYEQLDEVAQATTGTDGRYTISDVPPGTEYRVVFADCDADRWYRFVTETWRDHPGRDLGGDAVTVAPGATTSGIDAALAQTGVLHAFVGDATGTPVLDALVQTEPVDHAVDPSMSSAETANASGRMMVALVPGLYRVSAYEQRGRLATGWWDGRSWREEGDVVEVRPGADTKIRFALPAGAFITGRVTDAGTGAPIETALSLRRADDEHREVASAVVRDGVYRFGPLPTGRYRVLVTGGVSYGLGAEGETIGQPGWQPRWFGGTSFSTATTIDVTTGQTRSGIDVAVERAGGVSGTVVGPDGDGLGHVCVAAFDGDGAVVARTETFDGVPGDPQLGRFLLTTVPPGSTRIRFEDCSRGSFDREQPLAPRWSGGATRFADATPVTVRAGEWASLDGELTEPGGEIRGRLTGAPPTELAPPGCVVLRDAGDDAEPPLLPRWSWPSYVVRGVPAGTWLVAANECHGAGYAHPLVDLATVHADPVTVTPGATTTVDLPFVDRARRLSGETRIETAVAIAAATYDAAGTVVLGRSDSYADALTGGPLAASLDAPLLLSTRDALPESVAAEIDRLDASRAILLGGPAALGPEVADALEARGVEVERVAGADRFATAAAVADRLGGDDAFVVEGSNVDPQRGWPDAVAVASLAAHVGAPILLVERDRLPDVTAEALRGRDSATIVGGTAAVSADVERAVRDLVPTVDRLAGDDRYRTSVLATERGIASGLDADAPWVATGLAFPDALAAGPAAAHAGSPLVLVHGDGPTAATAAWLITRAERLTRITIAGDRGAVAAAVEAAFRRRLRTEEPWPPFPMPTG